MRAGTKETTTESRSAGTNPHKCDETLVRHDSKQHCHFSMTHWWWTTARECIVFLWKSVVCWRWRRRRREEIEGLCKKRSSEIMTCDGKSATRFVIIWNGQAKKKWKVWDDERGQAAIVIYQRRTPRAHKRDQELGTRNWAQRRRTKKALKLMTRRRHLTWHIFFLSFAFCLWSFTCLERWDLVMSSRKTLYGNLSTKKDDEVDREFSPLTLPCTSLATVRLLLDELRAITARRKIYWNIKKIHQQQRVNRYNSRVQHSRKIKKTEKQQHRKNRITQRRGEKKTRKK